MRIALPLVAALLTLAFVRPVAAGETPAGAAPALKKYREAVAAADAERARSIDRARAQLVKELKVAQKAALQNNDVDGATAIAVMAKQYAVSGAAGVPDFVNVPWRAGAAVYTLRPDGTLTKKSGNGQEAAGTWAVVHDRTVALLLGSEWVDVWTFAVEGKAFKAIGYARNGGYEGKAAR
jgi:hypothetical protein